DSIVIDLRYNREGLLKAATDICDMFLDDELIVTTRGRNKRETARYQARPGVELPREMPIVVLVDRLSASASEIVAACLQDNGRAAVAGQRTWGKGTVQKVITLEGGKSAIRLTVGSYHRPSGKDIHKWKDAKESDDWGVRPDTGLEALMTNRQNDVVFLARRKRDLTPWSEASGGRQPPEAADEPTTSGPPVPIPDTEFEPDTAEQTLEAEAVMKAKQDPATIDPQLRKALDYLQESQRSRGFQPRLREQ